MSDGAHYYTKKPRSESRRETIVYSPGRHSGVTLRFITDSGVFSKSRVDFGSDLLVRSLPPLKGRVLDLGCGYGVLGISLAALNPGAEVWFTDINERALALCRENFGLNLNVMDNAGGARFIPSDDLAALGCDGFSAIVTNPPIRAGKKTVYGMFADAFDRLADGGALYLVIQKKQGMESASRELERLFGNCSDLERKSGYHVLRAVKAANRPADRIDLV